jgi:hypothetical protein
MAQSKLTPETQARIVQAIGVGATYELAAKFGGVTYQTFLNWMKAGATGKSGRYVGFFEAVREAEGKAAVKWLAIIDKVANDEKNPNWQAAAWKLERRYPEMFGRRMVQAEVSGPGGGPQRIEVVYATKAPDLAAVTGDGDEPENTE